ncbi:hypothetical protein L596_009347 [Steinernema carpocapsae]|uniref:Uncharacterized protein n=1 Tax=Steinernema carpocapsae TaxID=34508 RepID=A0A4U5PF31_STECR|nr:hypothetical protein L596_009347 [Steinernema carpocapsae]
MTFGEIIIFAHICLLVFEATGNTDVKDSVVDPCAPGGDSPCLNKLKAAPEGTGPKTSGETLLKIHQQRCQMRMDDPGIMSK